MIDRAFPSYIREYKNSGYLVVYVTFTFHRIEDKQHAPTSVLGEPDTISPKTMRMEMERFYHRYRGNLIKNYHRPNNIPLSPYVVGFIDHPSSKKFSKYRRGSFSNQLATEKTLHVHAFYMLHPKTIEKKYDHDNPSEKILIDTITKHFNSVKDRYKNTIESIHIRMTDNDLEKAVKYSSKAIGQLPWSVDGTDYYFMLPKSKDEPRYQKTHDCPTSHKQS